MNIVVQGLGEMGASLALILNQQSDNHVIGVDTKDATRKAALKSNIVSEISDNLIDVAGQADIIILATPVSIIKQAMKELSKIILKSNVIITDTGSTKNEIMAFANSELQHVAFIGGHAMAGTHKTGVTYADERLYVGTPYFLIPNQMGQQRIKQLKTVLAPIQAHFTSIDVTAHDDLMAMVSDVPHIVAFALVNAAVKQLGPSENFGQYVAGGFKDTTRIAQSDPKLWTDVLLSNKASVLTNNRALIAELEAFNQALTADDAMNLTKMIHAAQISRQRLLVRRNDD
ncbi:prephenate dehydrogenase [Leuconostoc rapi]|uniref:prephenate dehydrogenase n=1 Tax=Leuconostoc rapi TaxID=1406906 RepID=UPI0019599522|nr:prephenate dehydrogenase/arogenate dehydrogenase family protein [Leuconostoc rapi]MBM7435793.1 prephenate dehydrogenase [Leuconostoc rapi]